MPVTANGYSNQRVQQQLKQRITMFPILIPIAVCVAKEIMKGK
jgi:hypothetical protein